MPLDVGDSDFLAHEAEADFDLDGNGEETNAEELTGLVGTTVTVVVVPGTTVVVAINGLGLRRLAGALPCGVKVARELLVEPSVQG